MPSLRPSNPRHSVVVFASNLPYYITTPILFKLFEAGEEIERITVMMQKEVGERFLAHENDKEYNALSVITQYRCDVKKVMDVSRRVFWPSPNVDSMVIQFSFHHKYHLEDENYFFNLVKACFTQRRKTIYNNFQGFVKDKALAKELLEQVNTDPSTRAQQCTLEDFIRLYEVTYESTRAMAIGIRSFVDFIVVSAKASPIRIKNDESENRLTSSSGAKRIPG